MGPIFFVTSSRMRSRPGGKLSRTAAATLMRFIVMAKRMWWVSIAGSPRRQASILAKAIISRARSVKRSNMFGLGSFSRGRDIWKERLGVTEFDAGGRRGFVKQG